MWALVEDNAIVKIINNPKAMVIGDVRHSRNIFSFRWTNEEREAIGLYEIVFDNSNKRDEAYYTNTNQSFDFADEVATASFGSATAKELDDRNATDDDGVELDPIVVIALGTAVLASAFLTIYQSVSCNIVAACFLTVLIKLYFNPLVATSPSVPFPSISSCAVHKVSACALAVALPKLAVTTPSAKAKD